MGKEKLVMVDLETMGNRSLAVIAQIGACTFSITKERVDRLFSVNVDIGSCLEHGLEADGPTIYWWLGQSERARASLTEGKVCSLEDALLKFSKFAGGATEVWSHSTFDFVILQNAYRLASMEPPFGYRVSRDIRTLESIAGRRPSWSKDRQGVCHRALDDAIFQAEYVIEAVSKIHLWRTCSA